MPRADSVMPLTALPSFGRISSRAFIVVSPGGSRVHLQADFGAERRLYQSFVRLM
jgi:hypothetical protein